MSLNELNELFVASAFGQREGTATPRTVHEAATAISVSNKLSIYNIQQSAMLAIFVRIIIFLLKFLEKIAFIYTGLTSCCRKFADSLIMKTIIVESLDARGTNKKSSLHVVPLMLRV